ncbi:hypothetical protein AC731_006820 [Thauera humireducens]|uniref:Uncharacterized protein n=1 Tax=Thauera humireducens TaxID=1134435 RepID=A0A127K3Z5_9RHOO|nr:hypothetical protein AC731_006820 [Thauera humireducens]
MRLVCAMTASQRRQRSERRFFIRPITTPGRFTLFVSRRNRQRQEDFVLDQREQIEFSFDLDRVDLVVLEFLVRNRLPDPHRLQHGFHRQHPVETTKTALAAKIERAGKTEFQAGV